MATNYTQPPPSYSGPTNKPSSVPSDEEAGQPLLGSPRAGTSSGAYYDQPLAGDVPDDFKVRFRGAAHYFYASIYASMQYGTCVYDSAPEIRNAFIRKVYTILCKCFTIGLFPSYAHN